MIKIALVGRPNAGKSSLFNRLARERDAITSEVAGTTRDVKKRTIDLEGREVLLLDTGGLEDRDEMFQNVRKKALQAAEEADIVLYIVDGKSLADEEDRKLFYSLQEKARLIALVVNKIDNEKLRENLYDFYGFGAEHLFSLSCSHNRGVADLTDWLAEKIDLLRGIDETVYTGDEPDEMLAGYDEEGNLLAPESEGPEGEEGMKVAIIGRPNVGKSSLLNALVGEERSVVSSIAGTTIDPVDETIVHEGREVTFVDTAGVRRRSRIEGIEKFAFGRTEKMLENADVALLVLDASEPLTELDERIAGLVDKHQLATILVLNKYDRFEGEFRDLEAELRRRFRFLEHAPMVTISAQTRRRVHKLWEMLFFVYENYTRRMPTGALNQLIKEAMIRHHPPSHKTRGVKIYFATQFDIRPPRVALVCNYPQGLHFSYLRYLANRIREGMELGGSPLVLIPRKRGGGREDGRGEAKED